MRKHQQVITYSLKRANEEGKKLEHPDLYHQKLMLRTGSYVEACTIMWKKFQISFFIETKWIDVKDES
jgi:hypothetical protein